MKEFQANKIIELLSKEEYVTANTLANELEVSDKTVRKFIKEINEMLTNKGATIESKYGYGFILKINDKNKYQKMISDDEALLDFNYNGDIDLEIAQYLLNSNGYVSTDEIAQSLFTSKQTVFIRINKIEKLFNNNNLFIKRRPGYGIKIIGSEIDKRNCFVSIIKKINSEEREKIDCCLKMCLNSDKYRISDLAYDDLTKYIHVMIQRIKSNIIIPNDEISTNINVEDYIQEISRQLSIMLEIQFQIKVPKSECKYLSLELCGKQSIVEGYNNTIDSEIMDLANKIIKNIKDSFNIDLSNDLDLLISLCNHLTMLKKRLELNVSNNNPMLEDIKKNYGLPYSMALQSCSNIYKAFRKKIKEDEVGYIALIFALSLEKKSDISKKSILLVCSTGKSSAQLLKFKYITTFKEYIGLLHVTNLHELENFNVEKYDYIFTTVNIPKPMPIPVVKVGQFLENSEIDSLKKMLTCNRMADIVNYFPEQLFIPNLKANNKEEAIKKMCKNIEKHIEFKEDLFNLVWERENIANTSYGNFVALPHPNKMVINNTTVSVGILNDPIDWNGGNNVQIIFLILVGKQEGYDIKYFYEILSSFIFDKIAVKTLIKKRDFELMINIFREKTTELIGG